MKLNNPLRLASNYGQIKTFPVDAYFALDVGWADTLAGGNAPYQICRKVGKGAMDFIVLMSTQTAAEAKQALRKLENEKAN